MRQPAPIKPWLSPKEMFLWLQQATDEPTYQRRMTIWLTAHARLHAPAIASALNISVQAVWLWVRQYNDHGPTGLDRHGRGGRRWSYLTEDEERTLVRRALAAQIEQEQPAATILRQLAQTHLGRPVSPAYAYRLLDRHRQRQLRQKKAPTTTPATPTEDFRTLTQPWRRHP